MQSNKYSGPKYTEGQKEIIRKLQSQVPPIESAAPSNQPEPVKQQLKEASQYIARLNSALDALRSTKDSLLKDLGELRVENMRLRAALRGKE